uniref:Uncharacterized protein n=1 Tax=Wuchereria bancrofti TaxID=6293 RepID=A0A1I8EI34_WUCBA
MKFHTYHISSCHKCHHHLLSFSDKKKIAEKCQIFLLKCTSNTGNEDEIRNDINMTISWYYELIEMLFRNVSLLLMLLVVCTFVSCKYQRKPKDPKFIDENDPHAKTLYNIKTDVAFPKRALEEKQQNSRANVTAMSWSHKYESNMPPSLSLSSSPNSKKYLNNCGEMQEQCLPNQQNPLPQQTALKLHNSPNVAISIGI